MPQDQSPQTIHGTLPAADAPASNPPVAGSPPAGQPPKKKAKRRRRWPYVLLGLFVALLVVVALVPTIASTAPVRGMILSQVNQNLNGRVSVEDWQVTWTNGLSVRKVQVFDANNVQVAQLDSLTTKLSLVDAIRGNLALGDTVIDGVDFTLVVEPDGSNNFAKLAKPSTKPDEPAGDLPLVSGKVTLKNARGTIVKQGKPGEPTRTVMLTSIAGEVTIPEINAPIASSLMVAAAIEGRPAGVVSAAGTTSVIKNRRVDLSAANLDQTVTLATLDAKAAAGFLPPDVAKELAGVFDGFLKVRVTDGKTVVVEGPVNGKDVAFAIPAKPAAPGQPAAAPEVYRTAVVSLVIPPTTITMPNGLTNVDGAHLRIGDAAGGTIAFKTDHANLAVAGDAPLSALLALADNKAPGAAGTLAQSLEVNLGPIAAMLPRTLGLRPGVKVTGGTLNQSFNLSTAAATASPSVSVSLSGVAGTMDVENADGTTSTRAIAIDPIMLDASFVSHGGGWTVPDLRKVRATLASGFGGGEVKADRLDAIDGAFTFDLGKLARQAGQFTTALDGTALAGTLNVAAKATGDAAKPTDPGAVEVTVTIADLKYGPPGGAKSIDQPLVRFRAAAGLVRDAAGELQKAKDVVVTASVGPDAARLVDFELAADEVSATVGADKANHLAVPKFTIRKGTIDLGRAKKQLAGVFKPIADTDLVGTATIAGGGSYVNDAAQFTGRLALADITATRLLGVQAGKLPIGSKLELFKGYALTLDVSADYKPDAAGNAVLRVPTLKLADNQNLLALATLGDGLIVNLPKDGTPAANGSLRFGVDAFGAKEVFKKYMATLGETVAYYTGPGLTNPRFRGGRVDGTVAVTTAADGATSLVLDADLSNINVTSRGQPVLENERAKLTARASVAGDFSTARLDQLDLKSGLLTVTGSAPDVRLKSGPGKDAPAASPLAMLRKATFTINAPDAARLVAVADTLAKWQADAAPAATVAAAATTRPTTPPVVPPPTLAGGAIAIKLDVVGDGTTLTVTPTVNGRQLVVGVGDVKYPIGDVSFASVAAIVTTPPPPPGPTTKPADPPSMLDQIASVRVPTLEFKGLGTTMTLAEPITVTGVAGLPDLIPSTQPSTRPASTVKATVAGAVNIAGQLEPLLKLQAVLGGKPAVAEYAGAFNVTQKLVTENGRFKLVGGGGVDDFVARDAQGKQTFAEKRVTIANDVALDPAGKMSVDLTKLTLAMESSKAVSLDVTGRITELTGRRVFDGTRATLAYDAEPLWKIIKPMLTDPATPPEKDRLKDWVVKGKGTRVWTVAGMFPAVDEAGNPVPFNVAIRTLTANGSIGIDVIKGSGLTVGEIRPVELPLSLANGVLTVADLTKPAGQQLPEPYACNGGTVNVGGAQVNLTGAFLTLSLPPNLPLLKQVQLNAALADFIGDYINNPLLLKPDSTNGLIDVLVVECRDVPLGAVAKEHSDQNKGYAVAKYSFGGIQLGNETWSKLAEVATVGGRGVNLASLQGSVKDGSVTYRNGYVGHDMTLALAEKKERTIRVYGDVRLSDGIMMPLTLLLSPEWIGGDFAKYLPKGLPLSLSGHFGAPQYDVQSSFQAAIQQKWTTGNPQDLLGAVGNLFNKGGNKKPATTPPSAGNPPASNPAAGVTPQTKPAAAPADPVTDILGGLADRIAKDKEKKEREKKEKERKEREKREGAK